MNPLASPAGRDDLLVPRYATAVVDLLEACGETRNVYEVGIPTTR